MDYGHALEFGAFITPSAAAPDAPVLLSQVAEASGLDLVTFQDHPYQPAFLDTWTLMSFVAARTDGIRIARHGNRSTRGLIGGSRRSVAYPIPRSGAPVLVVRRQGPI